MSVVSIIIGIVVIVGIAFVITKDKSPDKTTAEESAVTSPTPTMEGTDSVTPVAPPSSGTTASKPVTIKLLEQSGSRQSGSVVLTDMGATTKVVITLTGAASEVAMPSHIHSGTCEKSGAITYPLNDVVRGSSQTTVAASLKDIVKNLPIYVNVHKSAAQLQTSIACGSILKPSPAPAVLPPSPEASGDRFTVRYTTSGFSPKSITINRGEAIKFINDTNQTMWVASDPHPIHTLYPGFDEGKSVGKGGVFTFTFTDAGTWSYHNHNKSTHAGTIIVK